MTKNRMIANVIIFILLTCSVFNLNAQTDSTRTHLKPAALESMQLSTSNMGADIFRTLVSLAIVLGLVYLAMIGLKRFVNRTAIKRTGSMGIMSSIPLGAKKNLMIVQVEDRRLVLGVTDHHISCLCELDKDIPEVYAEKTSETDTKSGFQNILKQMIQKRGHDIEK